MDKKYIIGLVTSVIILPTLVFSWKNIQAVWATPEKLETVSKKVEKNDETQAQLTALIVEQKARIEKNEALDDLRAKNAQEQLQIIAELKKSKR